MCYQKNGDARAQRAPAKRAPAKKEVALYVAHHHQLSQRRACILANIPTCSLRYQSRRSDQVALRERLKELAQARPRFGYRRLHVMLLREGWRVNHKRVLRFYREEGLKLRPKKRKRITSIQRVKPEPTTAVNEIWTMDFVHDTLSCGRKFRALNVFECYGCPQPRVFGSGGGHLTDG